MTKEYILKSDLTDIIQDISALSRDQVAELRRVLEAMPKDYKVSYLLKILK